MLIVCAGLIVKNPIYAGAGKSFGFFAGGALAGAAVTTIINKRHQRRQEPAQVVETRYVQVPTAQQQPVQQVSTNNEFASLREDMRALRHDMRNLQDRLEEEQQKNRSLKRAYDNAQNEIADLQTQLRKTGQR